MYTMLLKIIPYYLAALSEVWNCAVLAMWLH